MFTRRDFIRIGAGTVALVKSLLLGQSATPPTKAATISKEASRRFGSDSEMAMAEAWVRSLGISAADSAPASMRLLPTRRDPPFSFVYGNRHSTELLPTWKHETRSSELDGNKHQQTFVYTDPLSGLAVSCEATTYKDFPAVEWVLHLKNNGEGDTPILENIQALDGLLLSGANDPTIHYAVGAANSLSDFMPLTRILGERDELRLEPGGGRSSSLFLPFFNIETEKEGAILAIGWTGEWAASFSHLPDTQTLQIKAGMAWTHLKLHPGEEIRTPRILMLFWQGEALRGHNLLRRFVLQHHRPTRNGTPLQTPITNHNWGGTPAEEHLANIRQIIDHDLPMDYYWIDAEWFGHGPWGDSAGNWEVKKNLYPNGFKPISDLLHSSGRKFLLWFEPERVCEGTPWYTEHARWLLDLPKDKRIYRGFGAKGEWDVANTDPRWIPNESSRNQVKENDRLFNLGIPEARQFLTDFISQKIVEFGLDAFRNDSNIAPLEFWRAADAPDRQGMTEIRWVEGLYAFWDELLRRHPGLIIDDCASGGRRIDLEMLSRSTPLSRTDFTGDLLANQCHTYGLLRWVPLNGTSTGNLGTDTDYRIRSSMTSGLSYGLFTAGDERQPKADYQNFPFDDIRRSINQYRSIQKYFYGDFYPLMDYSQANDVWIAYQFDLPEAGEGLVVILKREDSHYTQAAFSLKALDRAAVYEIANIDTADSRVVPGKSLLEDGIRLSLVRPRDSALFRYRQKS